MSKSKQVKWTTSQRQAIEADSKSRILVDAGPGTGKTATACARVAWLIENQAIQLVDYQDNQWGTRLKGVSIFIKIVGD